MKIKLLTVVFAAALGIAVLTAFGTGNSPKGMPTAVAHRGCWLREPSGEYYIPENSIAGVKMAKRFGYPAVECDVKYTGDSVMVLMHDGTINRTMRNAADYTPVEGDVSVSRTTFKELRSKYLLESSDPALRTPIPTLEEFLLACREYGIIPMLHSSVKESFDMAQKILGNNWIAFSSNREAMAYARSVSDCLVLLDPGQSTAGETLAKLDAIGGWCGMSTMKHAMLDAAYISAVEAAGREVQASIFPTPHEQRAVHDGVTIQLSDFWWYQNAGSQHRKPDARVKERVSLEPGKSLTLNGLKAEGDFLALTLRFSFKGDIEVTVTDHQKSNGKWLLKPRTYHLHRDTRGVEYLGLRLYKTAPEVTLSCPSGNGAGQKVKVDARLYTIE